MGSFSRQKSIWVSAILAVAVALRLINLSCWDMWTDEVHTLFISKSGHWVDGPMYVTAPINFFLTKIAVWIVGANELGLRIVPFFAGCITVLLTYQFGKRWIGHRVGLFASGVMAVSMWHIYWSQNGRHFSLQALVVLVASYMFLSLWFERSKAGAVATPVLLLTSLLVHSSSGFYVLGFASFVVLMWVYSFVRRDRRQWSASDGRSLICLGIVMLPLVVYLPAYVAVWKYMEVNRTAWNPPWNIIGSAAFYVPPYLAVPALAGVLFLMKEQKSIWLFLLCLIVIPLGLLTAASVFTIASTAYWLSSLFAVAVLVGVFCDRLLSMGKGRIMTYAMGIVVSTVFLSQLYDVALYFSSYHGLKPRWRDVCAAVKEGRSKGEIFLAQEGDVAQFYLGSEGVAWFGKFSKEIGTPAFPPRGVNGVWYGVYLTDSPILKHRRETMEKVFRQSKLVGLFPVHYGSKDRTIALFHEVVRQRSE